MKPLNAKQLSKTFDKWSLMQVVDHFDLTEDGRGQALEAIDILEIAEEETEDRIRERYDKLE